MANKKFKVVMREKGSDHDIVQTASCETRQQVIDFYGLEKPDIESYTITEL